MRGVYTDDARDKLPWIAVDSLKHNGDSGMGLSITRRRGEEPNDVLALACLDPAGTPATSLTVSKKHFSSSPSAVEPCTQVTGASLWATCCSMWSISATRPVKRNTM